jgi:ribonucleoside-diphosphate reductase alpha chain
MHATRLWTLTLEDRVLMAQFPSKEIARAQPIEFRTLGLGYANIGGLLMNMGLAYDSAEGRALCGALTALMTGVAYATSAEIAGEPGRSRAMQGNADHMLRVMRNHRRAAHGAVDGYEGLAVKPVPLDHAACPDQGLVELAKAAWDEALRLGRKARLPQRPGLRDRADRHHRAGDGLRHHRDRARFRAGEVQEAGRRRLFQDHQPLGARGA